MATSELPYRNNADWDALIDEVNDVLQNPVGAGCEPIDPLDHVGEKHRWAKSDLREMQDRIKETCPDIEFEAIPEGKVRWKQSFIDEIREKLGEAWCECEDDEYPCPNCGEDTTNEWYTDPYVPKWCGFDEPEDCALQPANVGDDVLAQSIAAHDALFEWINYAVDVCFLETDIAIKENQIDLLETRISSKQALEAVVCDDGPSEACSQVQAEIADLQNEKAIREAERDAAIAEKDEKTGLRDAAGEECETLNNALWSLLESMSYDWTPAPANLASLAKAAAGSHPWAEVAECTPAGINNCIPRYQFWATRPDGSYSLRFSGLYTPISGTAMHPPELFAHFQYMATNGSVCTGPDPSCTELGGDGPPKDYKIVYQPPACPSGPPQVEDEPDLPTSGL